jgi:uncharacterized membrane protein
MFDTFFEAYNEGDLLWLGEWSPTWLVILALVGVAVIAISAYDLRTLAPFRRWTLVSLRGAVYGLAVILLLEPAIDLKKVSKVKNDVAVLVDTSRTMSLKTDEGPTRYSRVQDTLDRVEKLADEVASEHNLHFYRFDSEPESTGLESLKTHAPEGASTDLTGALSHISEEFGPEELGGIVIISDGIDTGAIGRRVTRGEKLDQRTRELLDELDVPINTLSAADSDGIKDVAVARVRHDDFAFVHNKTSVEVELQVVGMGDTSFPVSLRREGDLVQTRKVDVEPGKTRYEIDFEFVPKKLGKEIYSVETPEFSGEALHKNNVSYFLQNVIRDKIRVLQVVGRPSWDERFLRRFMKKNSNVDLISFFILRTNSNVQVVPPDELSLIPFPTRELFESELGSFDVVIFQNFNFGPYDMDRYLDSIASYVRDGGAFAMLGGNLSFASGGYSGTPIEDILPVQLPRTEARKEVIDTDHFRPDLTDAGRRHPITQMAFDPQSNRKIWKSLPKLRGTNVVHRAKSVATVLARHPTVRRGGTPMPVLTVSEKGDGRVMALTSDSTWRWGFSHLGQGGTPREYQMFWNNAMRWLIKDPELKLIQVDVPDESVPPGETLEANVQISRPDYTAAEDVDGEILLRHRSFEAFDKNGQKRSGDTITTDKFTTDHNGQHGAALPVDKPGVYTVSANATTDAGDLEDSEVVLSVPDVEEFRHIVPRDDLMASLSDYTDGYDAVLPSFDPDAFRFQKSSRVKVHRRNVVHLWDSFAIFVFIVGLLGTEWTLRRRWGRL